MTDITQSFGTLYHPKSALVFYQSAAKDNDTYVEHFDMDSNGNPVNAHPLTVREANQLAKALRTAKAEKEPWLKSNGIISSHILHLDAIKGKALWFTKAMTRDLYFVQNLGIQNGKASVPPMLWAATRNGLSVFALGNSRRPSEKTKLYDAPFFNVYENGNVCMGTVDIRIKRTASLEEFTTAWESYFFDSYFSHLMQAHNPIKGNCVSLWARLVNTEENFPMKILKRSKLTLKKLML